MWRGRHTVKSTVLDFLLTDSVSLQRGEQHNDKVEAIGALKTADRFRPLGAVNSRLNVSDYRSRGPHDRHCTMPPFHAEPLHIRHFMQRQHRIEMYNDYKLCKYVTDLKIIPER